jgi:hypothetical protein
LSDPRDFHTPQPSYTKEDLLKSSEGGYFGPGNAQLPAPPMLMMDRITELSLDGGEFGKGHVRDFWSWPLPSPTMGRVAVVIEARRSLFLKPSPRRPLGIDGSRARIVT